LQFATPCLLKIVIRFVPNKERAAMLLGETVNHLVAVQISPPRQIAGNAQI